MKHFSFFSVILILFSVLQVEAQNISYAKAVIDTLTSDSFAGRGYVDNGIHKAADFIERHYMKNSLKEFGSSYRQEFSITTNIITSAEIGKGRFLPGEDYTISILSRNFKGKRNVEIFEFPTAKIQYPFSEKNTYSGKFVIFLPSMMDNSEQRDYIHEIIYTDRLHAAGYIIGTLKQPGWDARYFRPNSGKPIITMKGSDDFFLKLKKLSIYIESEEQTDYSVANIAGYFPGKSHPDSLIVFCAHYDHLGKMGQIVYPGANDNASGVAMMLDLMNFFASEENRLSFSVAFLAFASEEAGILGAQYFAEHPLFKLENVRFLINLDLVGTGKNGIQVINGSVFQNEFSILTNINEQKDYLPEIKVRGEACNSDHCPFYKKGVPCFFIYTLDPDYPWYHVPQDKAEHLPMTAYENLFRLIVDFSKAISSN